MRPKFEIKYKLYETILIKFDTQEKLARKIHMDPSYLSKILRKRQPVSHRTALLISNALKVETTEIFSMKH